jgi:hypothetical protein
MTKVKLLDELIEQEILLRQSRARVAELRHQLGLALHDGAGQTPTAAPTPTPTTARRRPVSSAGRKRIAAAQRARWAKQKVDEALTTPITTPTQRKAVWTPARRRQAAERMRKTNAKLQSAKRKAAKAA